MHPDDALVYDRPADNWLEALPLGNGFLGAMVFGGPQHHRFQMNHGTAWSGSPHSQELEPHFSRQEADGILARVRELVANENYPAAHETLKALQHRHSQTFLPFSDLVLSLSPVQGAKVDGAEAPKNYSRSLDLARGVNSTRYTISGHEVRVEAFISNTPSVLVVTVDTELPGGLDISLAIDSPLLVTKRTGAVRHSAGTHVQAGLELKLPADVAPSHGTGEIRYSDDDSLSLQGAVTALLEHDGVTGTASAGTGPVATEDGAEGVVGAKDPWATGVKHAAIYVSGATTFDGMGRQPRGTAAEVAEALSATLEAARTMGPESLLRRHEENHGALYRSTSLRLGVGDRRAGEPAGTNTAQRLALANAHAEGPLAADPGLAALLFNYGRYLLISSSRPGGTPANLQGIWNDKMLPPWSSNFTTNVNLEMNYWGAEVAGLGECVEPLFGLIDAFQVTGAATAKEYYGARGWAVHHNSDIWGYSKPVGHGIDSPEWSFWPMAGAWLVRHLWEHLQFGADRDFAVRRAWPAIRGQAEFLLDLLIEFPDGSLGTSPSTSPENSFKAASDGSGVHRPGMDSAGTNQSVKAAVAASSSMDLTLCRDVLTMVGSLAATLGLEDDPVVKEARAALPRIPLPAPGANGRLREWLADPPEWEEEHRHVSHLYLAYPGDEPLDAELEAAVRASLDGRGDDSTGWSLAWKMVMRARLRQPEKVTALMRLFFRCIPDGDGQVAFGGGLYPNLFAAHPPFQIDGNLGYIAAVAECLIQSHRGEIELLPALPAELSDGEVSGLRARPGVAVSLTWRSGKLETASFALLPGSPSGRTLRIRYGGRTQEVVVDAQGETKLDPAGWVHEPQVAAGR
ncbi:glycoside hydrolase family 95 protein [Arthrobacter rhizosphaerae]|uniref:glycoside hydrolase family 95 protein n=1 Tax=Arthrobacter rhizosphaerae TaxID=2855490 RepID=UPI001FF6AEFE|nr:glycoside hydrolase family 95 protein [Arthrobacter rhizosphaerae]